MADVPFGEVTERTEVVSGDKYMYLEVTFDGSYIPSQWDGDSPTLLHVGEDRYGWTYEIHGNKNDQFYKVEIDEDEAEDILHNESNGVWEYAELPN